MLCGSASAPASTRSVDHDVTEPKAGIYQGSIRLFSVVQLAMFAIALVLVLGFGITWA